MEPLLSVEAAVLLDGAVDVLDDPGVVNGDAARAVRELVAPLLLAVSRVGIHARLAEAGSWQREQIEPGLLDLDLTDGVVREQVAGNPKPLVGNVEAPAQKGGEEQDHRRV
jgi:hypothetical protein